MKCGWILNGRMVGDMVGWMVLWLDGWLMRRA